METRLQPPLDSPNLQMAAARRAVAEALLPRSAEPTNGSAAGGWRALAIVLWMTAVAVTALFYEITWHVAAN